MARFLASSLNVEFFSGKGGGGGGRLRRDQEKMIGKRNMIWS